MANVGKVDFDKKKKINVDKSIDELHVQFNLLQKRVRDVVDEFVETTDQALEGMRIAGESKPEFSKGFDKLRRTIKKSSKNLEDRMEDLLDDWKKEVRADIKNPERYSSGH